MLFGYLLAVMLVVRLSDSLFELPSAALLPELTKSYDDRTVILSIRLLMGLGAGMGMQILALRYFLKENAHGGGGVLAREGYFNYGLTSALVIGAAILLSGIGTHRRIPYLSRPPKLTPSIPAMLREVADALNNRSYLGLLAVGILMSTSTGAKSALELYFQLYFWALTQAQVSVLIVAMLVGTLACVIAAPFVARRFGKRPAAVYLIIGGVLCNVGPVLARLIGIMPANGSPLLFPILFVDAIATFCIASMTQICLTSMLNDVVEDVEVKTGRRSEGLLMAADTFFRKLVGGIGIFVAGLTVSLIAFPRHAARGSVAPEVIARLAYAYIPITIFLLASVFMLYFYRINRETHEQNLRILKDRRLAEAADLESGVAQPEHRQASAAKGRLQTGIGRP
jgi:Na+/melibiose symporter-like transporter